jgi:hypothetical protein
MVLAISLEEDTLLLSPKKAIARGRLLRIGKRYAGHGDLGMQ